MTEQAPQTLVALFDSLEDTTAALFALQDAGVPYANITMAAHSGADVQASLNDTTVPENVWSLAVFVGEPLHATALRVLNQQPAFRIGQQAPSNDGRDEVDRGRIAWGHYVFAPAGATDQVGDAAGTTGTTGIINSGVFGNDAHAEGKPAKGKLIDDARG